MIFYEEKMAVTTDNGDFAVVLHPDEIDIFSIHHGQEEIIVTDDLIRFKKLIDFAVAKLSLQNEDSQMINGTSVKKELEYVDWDVLFPRVSSRA